MEKLPESFFRGRNLPEKICLIIPPSVFLLDERVFPSLGILKLAAMLKMAGMRVDVLDLSGIKNFLDVVDDYARSRTDVKWFGITSTTPQLPAATKIADVIHEASRGAQIILGGTHITLVNSALKHEVHLGKTNGRAHRAMAMVREKFDVLVAGDGELAIFEVFGEDKPRFVDADDPKSEFFLTNEQLTAFPFPERDLVDMDSYHYYIDGVRATSLIAQLGCPFGCGFCGGRTSSMLRRIRTRTSENVVDEMELIYRQFGIQGFMFYDDELNVSPDMIELMDMIAHRQKKLGVEWKMRGFIKSQLFTDDQAKAMHRAGFRWILVGFESGSEAILEAINKKATRDENTRCMQIADGNGLKVKALMSIGHPGETTETIKESREWLLSVKPEDFDVSLITCYPGTPYYDQAIRSKSHGEDVWVYTHGPSNTRLYQYDVDYMRIANYYKGDPNGGYSAYVFTDTLTPDDLVRERDHLEREVRHELDIPFNHSAASVLYEHSMGQRGIIPSKILRASAN